MFKKMMKHLTNNLGLKLCSILLSVVLWMVVINIADPDKTKTFSIPVEIQNKGIIEAMGKVPDIVADTDIAVFSVTGPRSLVEEMEAGDFIVTADFGQMDLSAEGDIKLVPIEITPKRNDKSISINQRTVNMRLTLEDLSEQTFVISPETAGNPADGCAIGEVEVTPNLIKISGPKSVVSKISKVTAKIDIEGISGDVSDSVMPVLYDEEGNVITSELLEMNQSVVTIKANILSTKEVPINCEVTGAPADGYVYTGIEYAPDTVMIKGEASVLNDIRKIDIPGDLINIDGASANVDTTIDITDYLEELGVSLVDDSTNQIAVKALVEQKETRVFNLPIENINISGQDSGYELTYSTITIPVSIRALKADMDLFTIAGIHGKLNVSELGPGVHTVNLEVTLDDARFETVGTVSVQITIKDKNAVDESGATGPPNPGGPANSGGTTDNSGNNTNNLD